MKRLSLFPRSLRQLVTLSFVLILLYSLGQIRVAKPIELLHGEKTGEKPPKARWILALLGMLLLGTAYYLALTTKDPIQALLVLFIAIVLVIIASYLLFICGSVALCKMLQKNKKYYYKLIKHFLEHKGRNCFASLLKMFEKN